MLVAVLGAACLSACQKGAAYVPDGGDGRKAPDGSADALPPGSDGGPATDGGNGDGSGGDGSGGGTMVQAPQVTITIQRSGNGTVTGTGVNCMDAASCTLTVDAGSSLVLTANPGSDSNFTIWSGCDSANGPSCSLTNVMTSTQVTASFALKNANVIVVKDGNGTGTVTASWAGNGMFSCGADCSAVIPKNTTVTFQATPDTGSTFMWNTMGCTGAGPCMVTTGDAPMNVGATFTLVKETLTVTRTGNGTVTGTGNISCTDTSCPLSVNYGDSITLTAVPGADSDFGSWTGCTMATGTTCVVSGIKAAAAVSVAFKPKKIAVTIQLSGNGTVATADSTVSCTPANATAGACTVSVDSGTALSLTATPGSDSDFKTWSGCTMTTGSTCLLPAIAAPVTVSATFALKNASFVISRQGNGSGSVTATWQGGSINCGTTCSANIPPGTSVTVTGMPASAESTLAFSGPCTGAGTCMLTVPAAGTTVVATFTLVKYPLTIQASGSGTVTGTGVNCATFPCTASLDSGSTITLTATASAEYTFTGWAGCSATMNNTCTVSSILAAKTVTATFTLNTYPVTVQVVGTGTVAGTGVNCSSPSCITNVNSGTSLTLTATPDPSYNFTGWSGACTNATGTCALTSIKAAATVTATFTLKNASFNVSKAGNGSGVVTATWNAGANSINCGTTCSASIPAGTQVTLSATASSGSTFTGWSGVTGCTGTGSCVTSVAVAGTTVTATFALNQYSVSVSATGSGSVSGTGVNCTTYPCVTTLNAGASLALTATPAAEYSFGGWTGCSSVSGTGNTICNITSISGNVTPSVTFTLKQYAVTVNVSGNGTVTGTLPCATTQCMGSFNSGSTITLTSNPGSDSNANGWTGCSSSTLTTCTISPLLATTAVTASFVLKNGSLTISKGGNGGTGTVTASWAGGGSLNCGTGCSASIAPNTQVTLTATAGTGSTFSSWTGVTGCSTSSTCVVTIPANGTVNPTANFNVTTYLVQVSIAGPPNAGSVASTTQGVGINCGATCSAIVNYGTSVVLVASPAQNSALALWSGCSTVSGNMCTINVMGNATPKATFIRTTGGTCSGPTDCQLGFCVGGVCCATACNGECDQKVCPNGACTEQPKRTKCVGSGDLTGPGFEMRPAYHVCDGNGGCVAPTVSCGSAGQCTLSTSQWCSDTSSDYDGFYCEPIGNSYERFFNCTIPSDCPLGYVCCADYNYVDATTFCSQSTCPVQGTGADPVQLCDLGSGGTECTTQPSYTCQVVTGAGYNTCQSP